MILGPYAVVIDDPATILADLTALLWRHAAIPTPAIAALLAELEAATVAARGGERVTHVNHGRTLTVEQYHRLTNIPTRTIRDRCARGDLPAEKRGNAWHINPKG